MTSRPVLIAALLCLTTQPVRADRIDAKLNDHAPAIVEALRKHKLKTVGVLRFRAERGKKPESFAVGPINDGLAARLEHLLIIHNDTGDPLGVLLDPNMQAVEKKIGDWFGKPAERQSLFSHEYRLAWSTSTAKPEAFLTGCVRCSDDLKKTTVALELFRADDPKTLHALAEFTVDTDRLILADLGFRFDVAGKEPEDRCVPIAEELDRFAIGEVREREKEKPVTTDPPSVTPPGGKPQDSLTVGGVIVTIKAGGEAVPVRPAADPSAWQMTSPAPGKPVVVTLKNTTDSRQGVVLKLNGISTIFEQVEDLAMCRKWVLKPGAEITIRGFYLESKQVAPFKILVGEEAKAAAEQFKDKAGRIEVGVFAEQSDRDESKLAVSLPRRLSAARAIAIRKDLPTLQAALMKSAKLKRTTVTEVVNGTALKREIIVADKDALEPGLVKEVDFRAAPEPAAAATIQITKP